MCGLPSSTAFIQQPGGKLVCTICIQYTWLPSGVMRRLWRRTSENAVLQGMPWGPSLCASLASSLSCQKAPSALSQGSLPRTGASLAGPTDCRFSWNSLDHNQKVLEAKTRQSSSLLVFVCKTPRFTSLMLTATQSCMTWAAVKACLSSVFDASYEAVPPSSSAQAHQIKSSWPSPLPPL